MTSRPSAVTCPRVGIVFGTFAPDRNGGADFIARFADALCDTGVAPHVLTSPSSAPREERLPSGVVVHREIDDWTMSAAGRRALRRVNEIIAAERLDVLHVFFPDSTLGARYVLPAIFGLTRLPLITTYWSLGLGRLSPPLLRFGSAALLTRSTVVSSHDPEYLRVLRFLRLGQKALMLPVGTNISSVAVQEPAQVRARYNLTGEAVVGYFGHLDPMRGIDLLFDAVARIRRHIDVRVLMVGAAGNEEFSMYRRIPHRLGIADAVIWTGFVDEDEAANALSALDVCVLPYRRNSLGRSSLAAALTLGVPTVVTGTPASIAPLRPSVHVALAPRDDPDALASTIRELLTDTEARRRLAAGAQQASRLFEWPRIAATAADMYRTAARRRS